MKNTEQEILTKAIEEWNPVVIVSLFSGGYDSMICTKILHELDTHDLPVQVWAIDTQLSADGWREYVEGVALGFDWDFNIYDNKRGFLEFVEWVRGQGCPRTRTGHSRAFHRLKERGFDAILKLNKKKRSDKVLFVSGRRRDESDARKDIPAIERIGKSNKIFVAPIVHWTNQQCDYYRLEHNLPDNPFYDTVKGSGDCQCNWGRFITYRMLEKHSPNLAAQNVKVLNEISRDNHGYGWDGVGKGQSEMFDDFDGEAELTSPFLCKGCSRQKTRVPSRIIEKRYLQEGF